MSGMGCWWWWLLLLLLCNIIVLKRVDGFVNNPKIIAKDGHLIIESGLNRNISFKLSGTSRLLINDKWDLLTLLLRQSPRSDASADSADENEQILNLRELNGLFAHMKVNLQGPQGIEQRLRLIQNSTVTGNQLVRRYRTRVNNLDTRLKQLTDRLEQDNCKGNPCENGGTCYNLFNGFQCKCTKSFEGSKCERDVNECALYAGTDLGCQNGGECVNQFGSYACMCTAGWFGIHCTQRKDCTQSSAWELCGHGTCVSSSDTHGFRCICDQGWTTNGLTPSCMVDVDECSGAEADKRPACATKCINLPGSFMCAPCPPGLTGNGLTCRDIDECATDNGGCSTNPHVKCINTHGSYQCHECPIGWKGDGRTCTRDTVSSDNVNDSGGGALGIRTCTGHNICHPSARCLEVSNTVTCSCPVNMVGDGVGPYGCRLRKDITCNDLPCLNGGTCHDKADGVGYECTCLEGYNQPNCASTQDPCSTRPCANSGVCRAVNATFYQCHCMPGYSGTQCQSQSPSRCGGVLSGSTGQLTYPATSSSGVYEHNSQCAWVIRTNETNVLNVTFDTFDLEDTSECRADWLQINDGRTAAAQVLGRFCGTHKPMGGNIISSTNNIYLWFRSDNSSAKAGFKLHWNSIEPQCGGTIPVNTHGTIASPGSPGNYPKNRDCHWRLQAPNTKRIKLTFFSLNIEKHESCNFDYIEITDVISNQLVAKYCKSVHPEPLLVPSNEIDIHFHSDNEGSDTGFQIYYSVESRMPGCGGTYTAPEGTIKSPDNIVDSSVSCEYDIKLPVGVSIQIDFVTLELKSPNDCLEFYDINESDHINNLQIKYCGDYNIKVTKFNSLYNAISIKYFGKTSIFELNYRTDCVYQYNNDEGIITSLNYPAPLTSKERNCLYKITTKPGTVIVLHMVDFELGNTSSVEDSGCTFNALELNDDIGNFASGPYCNNNPPTADIVSTTNSLNLHFRTSAMENIGRGFKLEYKAIPMNENDCGGVYTASSGTIKLPTDESGNYMDGLECYWIIKAPPSKRISLNWKTLKLELENCIYDYLELYDSLENKISGKPLDRYCGTTLPPSLVIHSSMVILKFVSDDSETSEGFEVNYDFIDDKSECGGNLLASAGTLTSPAYPSNYTNGMDCIWTITAPKETQIELQVEMFEVEATEHCTKDWLQVRNGGSERAHIIGSFCGIQIPKTIPSFTNQMRLHFHSDNFVSARGFKIQWNVFSNNCGGTLSGNYGVITSPNYPQSYPENAQCEWLILVKKGSAIQITIEDMKMESLFGCSFDRLQIFHDRFSDNMEVELCELPDDQPKVITISNHESLVRFETDSSNTDSGFLLSYKSICTITHNELFGVIESPNYNDPFYNENTNCTWTLEAPKGNKIIIELTYFNSHSSNAIYFVDKSNGTHAIHNVQTFNSSGDTIQIIQNSSSVSFHLEYQVYGCVQQMKSEMGEFNSPNYPNTYSNNIVCLWTIVTRPGKGIEFTIEDIDIEESVNCTNDALVISSDPFSHSVKERHCGKFNTDLVISSSSHRMYVRFESNSNVNGKGFTAKYRTIESSCGSVLQSRNGVVQSPNYPKHYPPKSDCEWIITVSEGHTITFTLEELEIEDFFGCEMDYVELSEIQSYDSDDENTTNNYEFDVNSINNRKIIFNICGSLSEKDITQWTTSTNTAKIRFHSDDSQQHKGFKLSYQENCGQRITVKEDSYGSIDIVRTSGENQTCIWEIKASDRSKKVMLNIGHVSLTAKASLTIPDDECITNGVKIIDGTDIKGPVSYKFCRKHPPDIISKSHALTVIVPLSMFSEFSAMYYVIESWCGGFYTGMQGTFSTPLYPNSYPPYIDCEWYLTASEGNSYALTFETMSIEESEDCNRDYVEIREVNSRGRLLGLFCGSTVPPSEPLNAREIWIKFSSDDNGVAGQGFIATYNYVTHNEFNGTNGTIESPHYPTVFQSNEIYSWRILVDRESVVMLTISHIVDVDRPYIKFYDGYMDIGAPIDYSDTLVIRSHTSALYITATRGPFKFQWESISKEAMASNETAERMLQECNGGMLNVKDSLILKSPGYPTGYANELNCSWIIMPQNPAMHVELSFVSIDLEEFQDCAADYLLVFSSNDLQHWHQLAKLCKKANTTIQTYKGTPYLKLKLITDSSVNKTGFTGVARTNCGSEITGRNGFVNMTELIDQYPQLHSSCVWTIRVREGRRIRITFPDLELKNSNNNCRNYVVTRNGISEDSPFLGRGKICDDNATDILETSSNWAYIKLNRILSTNLRIAFHFEEIAHECSDDIQLGTDFNSDQTKTISSPNYPNLPNPHSECVWRITAPINKVIAINFIDRFELADELNCEHEYIQINDGATELMPSLGRYCGTKKPDTKYSSSNILRVKYFTDLSEPHVGFKANVSIGQCGGLYFQTEGIINSPTHLNLRSDETNFECVYTIEMEQGHTINLTIDKIDLPSSENCSEVTHIELQEINRNDDGEYVSDTLRLCGGDEQRRYIVETNKLVVRYKIFGVHDLSYKFQISYNTIGDRCGQRLIASRGTLQSPHYPMGVIRPTHCSWHLTVPKGRRVKVEFLDFDTGAIVGTNNTMPRSFYGRIVFANDFELQSVIARVTSMPSSPLYSTDNTMTIDSFILPFRSYRGFRLRFSSDEENTKCRETMISANLIRYQSDDELYCRYNANVPPNRTLALHVLKYEHTQDYLPTFSELICNMKSPLKLQLETDEKLVPNFLCQNTTTLPTLRLPFAVMIILNANSRNKVRLLEFDYKVHKCGGLLSLDYDNVLNITQPIIADLSENTNKTVECAWLVGSAMDSSKLSYDKFIMEGVQLELTVKLDLKGNCEDQYLQVYNGPNHNAPSLGRLCGQATATNLVVEHGVFFEYFATNYELKSTFNVTIRHNSGCGGTLTYPYRLILFSDQYINNIECIWKVVTDPGFIIRLTFVDRFFIESSANCTKDYILVQEPVESNVGEWRDLKRICGREAPNEILTTAPLMRFIFRSDNETRGDGFIAKFDRVCGGTYYANNNEQELVSPGYPTAYPHNLTCKYIILPPIDSEDNIGVVVRFLDFDLETPPIHFCMFDNVTVTTWDTDDSNEKPKTSVICGVTQPPEFRARKRISIQMRTDNTFAMRGFKLSYSVNVCGGIITNTTLIESPRHHLLNKYPLSSKCYWIISAPVGYKINVKFEYIDFESVSNCLYDGVEVYNDLEVNVTQRLGKFCGNFSGHRLPELTIPSNTGLLYSYSDDRDPSDGFRALVVFKLNCDQYIFLDTHNNTFTFDTYANGYTNNLDCEFVIKTQTGRQLLLHFTKFHVEESDGCLNDYLELRDGSGTFADQIAHLCGHDMPLTELMSSQNAIYMRFFSDGENTSGGFSIIFTSVEKLCGQQNLQLNTGESIELKSPMHTNGKYLKNMNCLWKIKSNSEIQVHFDKLDIEGTDTNGSCSNDYLKIFSYAKDKEDDLDSGYGNTTVFNGNMNTFNQPYDFSVSYVYCGNVLPSNEIFMTNVIYVKFVTNGENERTGFSLTAHPITGCVRNFTALQGRIVLNQNKFQDCNIYITVPSNYTLTLYYSKIYLYTPDCNVAYIDVLDANTNKILQKNCASNSSSNNLYSNSSSLRLNIKTSEYSDVDITYVASNEGLGCGGTIYSSAGAISSPLYPNTIREYLNCRWHIQVPKNLHVFLTFDVFDMGAKTTCQTDYLQIIEHNSSGSEDVVRQFCGEDQPKFYRSTSNYVTIYFHKTLNFDGTGWVISYKSIHPETNVRETGDWYTFN